MVCACHFLQAPVEAPFPHPWLVPVVLVPNVAVGRDVARQPRRRRAAGASSPLTCPQPLLAVSKHCRLDYRVGRGTFDSLVLTAFSLVEKRLIPE